MFSRLLKILLHYFTSRFEKKYDYDMGYAHEMIEASASAFIRFSMLQAMGSYRGKAPTDAWFTAKITATLSEDCGPCTQLVIKFAREAGMADSQLQAVVEGNVEAMNKEVLLAHKFAGNVLAHAPEADEYRNQIVEQWGDTALAGLTLAIASARVYPTVKYAMGHGKACQVLQIGDQQARPATSI